MDMELSQLASFVNFELKPLYFLKSALKSCEWLDFKIEPNFQFHFAFALLSFLVFLHFCVAENL